MSRRKSTNVRSCCVGVPSSSLHPLSLHTAPQPGEACPQFASPAIGHSRKSLPSVTVIVPGPCTRSAGACWGQLLASQSPLQCRSRPVATHSHVVTVGSHTRGWFTSARALSPEVFVPAVLTRNVLGAVDVLHLPAVLCGRGPSMLRLAPDWALPTFADLQSTMSNQRWASPLVLSPIPAILLDSTIRRVLVHSPSCAAISRGILYGCPVLGFRGSPSPSTVPCPAAISRGTDCH
jgi:hypothetical protein